MTTTISSPSAEAFTEDGIGSTCFTGVLYRGHRDKTRSVPGRATVRAVVQRVNRADVRVEGQSVGAIEAGLLVLLGVHQDDAEADVESMASKIAHLRILADEAGRMNRSVMDAGGAVLLVSQFTLCGDVRKGRRPNYSSAAPAEIAERRYLQVADRLRGLGLRVALGSFGANMEVESVNDGPVTILLDTHRVF